MKKLIIALTMVALLIGALSCSSSSPQALPPSAGGKSGGGITVPGITQAPPNVPGVIYGGTSSQSFSTDTTATTTDRLIVRTGNIDIVVKDVTGSVDKVSALAVSLGGFVVSSQITGTDADMRGSISIRIPAASFDDAMTSLKGYAVKVNSASTNSQDVTDQYVDLQARLKTAQAAEQQYLVILQKATTVTDTLQIYSALTQVRTQIEQLQGQIQYLDRTTSMSLISVQLSPEASGKPLVTGWNFVEIVKSAIRGMTTAAQVVLSVLIWVAVFSPLWVAALVVIWLVRRRKKAQ
jgi:hypothetical protein